MSFVIILKMINIEFCEEILRIDKGARMLRPPFSLGEIVVEACCTLGRANYLFNRNEYFKIGFIILFQSTFVCNSVNNVFDAVV